MTHSTGKLSSPIGKLSRPSGVQNSRLPGNLEAWFKRHCPLSELGGLWTIFIEVNYNTTMWDKEVSLDREEYSLNKTKKLTADHWN